MLDMKKLLVMTKNSNHLRGEAAKDSKIKEQDSLLALYEDMVIA